MNLRMYNTYFKLILTLYFENCMGKSELDLAFDPIETSQGKPQSWHVTWKAARFCSASTIISSEKL